VIALIRNGITEESKIMELLKCSKADLFRVVKKLIAADIIIRWRDKNTSVPSYTLNFEFFDITESCKQCRYRKTEVKDIGSLKFRYLNCSLNGTVKCIHNYQRENYNICKLLSVTHDKVSAEVLDRKNRYKYNEDKDIEEWNIRDFVEFYREECIENFPTMIMDNNNIIRSHMRSIVESFKKHFKGKWQRFLKLYMNKQIDEAKKERRYLPSIQLARGVVIANFLRSVKKKGYTEVGFCKQKNLYCSYCDTDSNICKLKKDKLKCTRNIRKKMKKLYN